MFVVRKRIRLPHWDVTHRNVFVTFNLFDAIPAEVRERLELERRIRITELERLKGKATAPELAAIDRVMRERTEEALDESYGSCFMRDPRVAQIVADALAHFEGKRYCLKAWCVMPNHVHVVFEPREGLATTLHSWKSFTAKEANRVLLRKGDFWQDDYFDRLIRSEVQLERTIKYVLDNPTRAGLKNWPFVGERASRPQSPAVPAGD